MLDLLIPLPGTLHVARVQTESESMIHIKLICGL
jgi:hypothetical protein